MVMSGKVGTVVYLCLLIRNSAGTTEKISSLFHEGTDFESLPGFRLFD